MNPIKLILEISVVLFLICSLFFLVTYESTSEDSPTTNMVFDQKEEAEINNKMPPKSNLESSLDSDKKTLVFLEQQLESTGTNQIVQNQSDNLIAIAETEEKSKRVDLQKVELPKRNYQNTISIRDKILSKLSSGNQSEIGISLNTTGKEDGSDLSSWTLLFKDKDNFLPLEGVMVRKDQLSSVHDAYGQEGTYSSDHEGRISLADLKPETLIEIYHYDTDKGIKLLAKASLKIGEKKEQTFFLDLHGRKPGAIGFRLQDKEGLDIHEGWISNLSLASLDQFNAAQSEFDFLGSLIIPGSITWIEKVPSKQPIKFYYGDGKNELFFLGEYTLDSEERLIAPIIRIDYDNPLKRDYAGTITDEQFQGIEKIVVKASYQDGREIIARTNESGYFVLYDLDQKKAIHLSATRGDDTMVLYQNLMINETTVDGENFIWKIEKSLNFQVFGDQKPLAGTGISLINGAGEVAQKYTDNLGLATFNNIQSGLTYTLRVSEHSSFYEPYINYNFVPSVVDQKKAQTFKKEVIHLKSRPGVRVKIQGPTWYSDARKMIEQQYEDASAVASINPNDYAMSIKAWIGISDGKNIIPDQLPGNEYSEDIVDGELVFLTPPNQPFWIYIGGLPIPWGNALFGPFEYKSDEIIAVQINRVGPLNVRLVNKNVLYWNLLVFKHDSIRNLTSQIKGSQKYGVASMYLGADTYMLKVQHKYLKTFEKYITLSGEENNLELELEENEKISLNGGYIQSFLVSDRFDLLLNEKVGFHHGEMCYGFNKDLLSHLEGEAHIDAFEFREDSLHQSGNVDSGQKMITWRVINSDAKGILDLKTGLTVHDNSVRYMQTKVYSNYEREITLGLSSDDGVKVWVNGELVHNNHIARPIHWTSDSDFINTVLKQGWNRLTFKVDNSLGAWMFKVRLLDRIDKKPIIDLELKPNGGYTKVY